MKNKTITLSVILLLSFLSINTISTAVKTQQPQIGLTTDIEIVYVDDDYDSNTLGWGIDHFNKIQDGINTVKSNGLINVYNGEYFEHIIVTNPLQIIGENKDLTIIDGNLKNSPVVDLASPFVKLINLTVRNGKYGLRVKSDNCEILSCNVYNNLDDGIIIKKDCNIVKNCTCHDNNDNGLKIDSCNNNNVENCLMENNKHSGVFVHADKAPTKNNKLFNCTMQYNGRGIFFYNNKFDYQTNNHVEKCVSQHNDIKCDDWPGHSETYNCGLVAFVNAEMILRDNKFNLNPGMGFYANGLESSMVSNCEFNNNNGNGLHVLWNINSDYTSCSFCKNNDNGAVFSSNSSKMLNCKYNENKNHGVVITGIISSYFFDNCTFQSNKKDGINIDNDLSIWDEVSVSNCSFTRNYRGVSCGERVCVNYCTFKDNQYGMYINRSRERDRPCVVRHNDFVDNDVQVFDFFVNIPDIWNDSSIGNFWNDYDGKDQNRDGVGDTPYDIPDCYNSDFFPSMKRFNGIKVKTFTLDMMKKYFSRFDLPLLTCFIYMVSSIYR